MPPDDSLHTFHELFVADVSTGRKKSSQEVIVHIIGSEHPVFANYSKGCML